MTESDLSHKAAANSLPLQDAFAVLFFISVGMLFDPSILITQPLKLAAVLLLILWLLGMVSSYTLGGFIHILLILAVVAILIRIIQGRSPV